jgi:GNAT superfamily N-acetyltransferase
MIRDALAGDVEDLARVHVTSWQKAYVGLIDQAFLDALSVETRAERWRALLEQGRGRVLVVEWEGSVVGFCSLGPAGHGDWGEVYAIYLAPDRWGEGLGRDLLAASESALWSDGHHEALLWVLAGNSRARTFYERQGWRLGKPIRLENIGGVDVTEVRYEKSLGHL